MIDNKNIAFIGAGFMGSALIRGLVKSKTIEPARIMATDLRKEALTKLADETGIKIYDENNKAVDEADIIVLAVKPQAMEKVIGEIGPSITSEKLVISIAAGVNTASLAKWAPAGAKILRAMPNMGADVGEGATCFCRGTALDENDITMAKRIFDSVGKTVEVEEEMMDAVTGLSGSGPAFVFLFLEAMIEAGERLGLSKETSITLATQTLYGAATLALKSGESPASLRERITSPGGTTLAGLKSMEESGFRGAVIRAVAEAAKRSKEMGS